MENIQPNRLSSAPTRKRRSSILKAGRGQRTPFAEVELHVATPTDVARTRRVSFSRRTGVAEFVTNEATTTWKNFYEEQNKTLESSGNDSELKKPSTSDRIFQFQEVEMEVVDALGSTRCFNNVNLTDQLMALDETDRRTVTAPKRHFDLSSFTENRSDVFKGNADDLEPSGNIPIDFSALQTIGSTDLDELERDIGRRAKSREGRNISEFIEVDLNVTQAVHLNGEVDMSITDTVLSPKREVSNESGVRAAARMPSVSGDWLADKENVVVNPYVAGEESDNPKEQVLIFNGKNLKYANIDDDLDDLNDVVCKKPSKSANSDRNRSLTKDRIEDMSLTVGVGKVVQKPRRTILYEQSDLNMTRAASVVLNCNDAKVKTGKKNTTLLGKDCPSDMSMTQSLPSTLEYKRNTHGGEQIDMSLTMAVPIVSKSKTIYPTNQDISLTECIQTTAPKETGDIIQRDLKRNTILFDKDNEDGNISITQCIPSILISKIKSDIVQSDPKRNTILFDKNNEEGDISITQCIPSIVISNIKSDIVQRDPKRNTILFDKNNEEGDISITQCIPSSAISNIKSDIVQRDPKRNTILFDKNNEEGDISITQCIPSSAISNIKSDIVQRDPKRNTILFDKNNEEGDNNMSITQCVPAKVVKRNSDSGEAKTDMESAMSVQNNSNIHTANNEEYDMSLTETLHTKVPSYDTAIPISRQVLETIHSDKLLDLKQETEKDLSGTDSQTDSPESDKLPSEIALTQSVVCAPIHMMYRCEESVHTVARDRTATWANNVSRSFTDTPDDAKISDEDMDLDNISQEYSTPLDCEYTEAKPVKTSSYLINELLAMSDESVKDSAALTDDLSDANKTVTKSVHMSSTDTQEFCSALKRKLKDVAGNKSRSSSSKNRHIEKVVCPESRTEETCSKDDTNELLEMLSEFTGTVDTSEPPTRRTIVPPRKSTALSYHDLFNNISMAQAMLQRSTSTEHVDESCVTDTSTSEAVRASVNRDVIKTLHFEDDAIQVSPLRKNTFDEPSPVRDTKTIPGYMSDVSQNLKELMTDLVKPMADMTTFTKIGRSTSPCNVQIQANLITSSQVDMDVSTPPEECAADISQLGTRAIERALGTRVSPVLVDGAESFFRQRPERRLPSVEDQILTFDQFNPLNNILLRPIGPTDIRRPEKDSPERFPECPVIKLDEPDVEPEPEPDFEPEPDPEPSTAARSFLRLDQGSRHSVISSEKISITPSDTNVSVDHSTGVKIIEMRDTEVNTIVAMKDNKELLNTHSALTINDDQDEQSRGQKRSRDSTPRRHGKLQKYLSGLKIKVARKSPERKPNKTKETALTEPGTEPEPPSTTAQPPITIQQVTTHFNIEDLAQETMVQAASEYDGSETPSLVGSFTSSKYNVPSDCAPATPRRLDFAAELRDQIDALPFMGSPECAWESRAVGGAPKEDGVWWWFRLLHSRLRLGMRLVASDARAQLAEVVLRTDLKGCRDPVVALSAKLAAEAAREAAAAAMNGSGHVPALVRRCAGVARLAAQWARSLHDARLRLACRVDEKGTVSFNVANVPLRCVWEVRFQVELAPAEGGGLPWPRAVGPTARLVPSAPDAPPSAVRAEQLQREVRTVAHDWGHVPVTIWRVFRLLKNKTRDDELLKGF